MDNMEENFTPSVFAQADAIIKDEGLTLKTKEEQEKENSLELDVETLEICIAIPFDIAALATKIDELELDDEEKKKIAKVWLKPLQRLLSKYPNSDVALAAITTLGIGLEKYLIYVATVSRNKARDAGKRENEQLEGADIRS
jgi:aconitase A